MGKSAMSAALQHMPGRLADLHPLGKPGKKSYAALGAVFGLELKNGLLQGVRLELAVDVFNVVAGGMVRNAQFGGRLFHCQTSEAGGQD
jgi:hypothetical protein